MSRRINRRRLKGFCAILISASVNAEIAIRPKRMQDDTHLYKVILGSELNLYRNTVYDTLSLQYYGSSWSFGLQSANIRLAGKQAQNYESDTYINIGRSFDISEDLKFETGAMIGTNMNDNLQQLHATATMDINYQVSKNLNIHFGGYYVNDVLATIHQPYNFSTGFKYHYKDVVVLADYYSGNNNMSGTTFNVFYKLTSNFRPYVGVIVPERNSGNEFAGVVGFTTKLND